MNHTPEDAEKWGEAFLGGNGGRLILGPPSAEEDLAAEAGAEGIAVAMRTAEAWDCKFWPTGEHHWQLKTLPVVREQIDGVMSQYRHPMGPGRVEEWSPRLPGVKLPTWDDGDPACMRTAFVVFARSPEVSHSMRFDTVDGLLERRKVHRHSCDWRGLNLMCADYAPEHLLFSRGQFVVAFATCFACKSWLLAGAVEQASWVAAHQ